MTLVLLLLIVTVSWAVSSGVDGLPHLWQGLVGWSSWPALLLLLGLVTWAFSDRP